MSWYGKICGTGIGYLFGGVYGAVAGGIIGYFYDRGVERKYYYDKFCSYYCPHCQTINYIMPWFLENICYNCSKSFNIVVCPYCKDTMAIVPGYDNYECCYCNKIFYYDFNDTFNNDFDESYNGSYNFNDNFNNNYNSPNENVSNDSLYEKYLKVLGCSQNDNIEIIKKRYRMLAKEFHPDKISGKNLSSEFVEFANCRFKEINEAYQYIIKIKK